MSKKRDVKEPVEEKKEQKETDSEKVINDVSETVVPSEGGDTEEKEEKCEDETESPEDAVVRLEGELKEANNRYLRLMAEFDNYKKRTSREYQRMVESANERIMNELIDVRNTFELAIVHGEKSDDYQKLFDGLKLIYNKFDGVLSAHGLAVFAEIGDEFDPQVHDALMKAPHGDIPEDHVAEIYEKGYRLNDRILKHAKVIVSSGKPVEEDKAAEKTSAE